MNKKRYAIGALLSTITFVALTSVASAHSTVTPSQTFTAKNETYAISVPTEKEVPTIAVRLLVPAELDRVTPLVKPGWRISITKDAAGKVTQITWTGGSIPAGQKDLFQFSARAPQQPTTLVWKVYQTYQGGEIVAWDQDPNTPKEGEEKVSYPYSVTAVAATSTVITENGSSSLPLVVSFGALAVAIASMLITIRRRA